MKLTLERAKLSATSGKNMIIECLETSHISRKAASESDVRYGFSGKRATRYVKIGGYLVSSAASAAERTAELRAARRILARISAPGDFTLRVDGVRVTLTCGELDFERAAPFSGDTAEKFTLRAAVRGGYFYGDEVTHVSVREPSGGVTLPVTFTEGEGIGAASLSTRERIILDNPGDVAAPFTAELRPTGSIGGASIVDRNHGRMIVCTYDFAAGDRIIVSTAPETAGATLIRGSTSVNLAAAFSASTELFSLAVGTSELAFYYKTDPIPATLTYSPMYTSI